MFAIPGIVALITFIYVRPQEFVPFMARIPFLNLFFLLSVFGLAVDLRLRVLKPLATPQLPWVLVLFAWMIFTVAVRRPDLIQMKLLELAILVVLYVVIAHGVQTFRGLEIIAALLVALLFFLTTVSIHQGLSPFGCGAIQRSAVGDHSGYLIPDGRPCELAVDCYNEMADPGAEYGCERIGLFGTTSIGRGRVRYRGVLQDPNELALSTGCALALAFGFVARRRSRKRIAMLLAAIVTVGVSTVFTQSRGGQLVFLTVLGVYFVRRYGTKGLGLGLVLAAPLLLLGGRGGEEAGQSTMDRYEAWRQGLELMRQFPLLGAGQGQFTEHHHLTAHNSYVLPLAELGLPGFFMWSAMVYLSLKIAYTGMKRFAKVAGAEVARDWGTALFAGMIALLIGIMFLSMSYHYVVWIYLALCGAYYSAAKTHDPTWQVRLGLLDAVGVAAFNIGFIVGMSFYLRFKGF